MLVAVALTALTVPLAVRAQAHKPSEYAALRDRVKSGDQSVDFARLRISYVDSPEFKNAKDTSEESTKMSEAFKAREFKQVIKTAEVVLENNYTDLDAHFYAFTACRELGEVKQAEFHRAVFKGLVDSILHSGDGKTPETAYVVVTVHEEYVVLSMLGLQPQGQALLHDKGHSYDVMKAKDKKSGEAVTLYFNADIPFKSYEVKMK
ncbi:MAG: DUF4919 domain-containing protein [Acidobacteriia bacterium]|nr:DUF4919 domain-containing protein [Terriglobia bacterium]